MHKLEGPQSSVSTDASPIHSDPAPGPGKAPSSKRCNQLREKNHLGTVECNPTSSTSAAQPSAKHCRSPRHAENDTQQKYPRWYSSDEVTSGRIGTWVPRGDTGADTQGAESVEEDTPQKCHRRCGSGEFASGRLVTGVPQGDKGAGIHKERGVPRMQTVLAQKQGQEKEVIR